MPEFIRGLKFLWKIKESDQAEVQKIAHANSLSFPVAQALYNRGYLNMEQAQAFLFSSFERDVSHPSKFKGMELAVARILCAIEKNEKILIFGDYDVDGITSTSLLLAALIPFNAQINYFLPMRSDGYGLSASAVQRAFDAGYKLIITVDNGITAFDAAKKAEELRLDLIITDHHRPHDKLPYAVAIINPNQNDCEYPFKEFAGVGVIFKLISLIYEYKNLELPDKIYELLILGTIADVTPLIGENRFWVKFGLGKVNKKRSIAFEVLRKNASLNKSIFNSLDIGFMIAPQLNALGRLSNPRQAVRFLISSDSDEVERIGQILKEVNEARKKVDRQIYEEVEYTIQNKSIDLSQENLILAASRDWPAGIIGLVAGKLAQNYGKPAILLHIDKNGNAAGSCRSVPEINIFDVLASCKDLLISFGGHSFAAGLKIKQENLSLFKERFEEIILKTVAVDQLVPKLEIDGAVQLPELNKKLISDLEQLEPFGNQNPQPLFLIKNVSQLKPPTLLKDLHVKCTVFADGVIKPVIFFNRPELFNILSALEDKPFNIAGYVMKNEWEGVVQIELQGLDVQINQ
ncbi:MAG: single-stranded-DNA-specific exonuclease RecJ [bacterium]